LPRRLATLLRWLAGIGIVVVTLFALFTLPGSWRCSRLILERNALEAQLDRDEPGWRWEELIPTKLPREENGALIVLEIAKAIPNDFGEKVSQIEGWPYEYSKLPHIRLPQAFLSKLGRELSKVESARQQLPRLVGVKTGDYQWDHSKDNLNDGVMATIYDEERIPWWNDSSRVAQLLYREHDWLVGTKQADKAVENVRCLIGFERTWNRFTMLSYFRIRYCNAIANLINRVLAQTEPSDQALEALALDIEALRMDSRSLWFIQCERALMHKTLEQAQAGLGSRVLKEIEKEYAFSLNSGIEWLDQFFADHLAKRMNLREILIREQIMTLQFLTDWNKRCSSGGNINRHFGNAIDEIDSALKRKEGRFLLNNISRWKWPLAHWPRTDPNLIFSQLAIACKRYRLRYGVWPESMAKLKSEKSLMNLSNDDLSSIEIKQLSDGLVIYVNPPKDPKNIQVLTVITETGYGPGPDVGVRLWDPEPVKKQAK
jgi:hypothetical protein